MNLAAAALLALVFGLLFFDYATLRGRGRRMLRLQAVIFVGGAFFIVFPDVATRVAHLVGIGRGVDFLIYPLVIGLVRAFTDQYLASVWSNAAVFAVLILAIALAAFGIMHLRRVLQQARQLFPFAILT